eukprot:1161846-Pelagomonas_calceolata.AAC.8
MALCLSATWATNAGARIIHCRRSKPLQAIMNMERTSGDCCALPGLQTKHSPSSSKPPMLDRVKDMFTRGPTASLIGSPRTHDNSSGACVCVHGVHSGPQRLPAGEPSYT